MRKLPLFVALLLAPFGVARADLLYVLNSGGASVSLVDAATLQEIRRLPVLREPHHVTLTPDRKELVIADSGGNELIFLDPMSGEVRRRERISNPYHLEYSPDGRFLVIASLRRDQVDIYAAGKLELLHRFRAGDMPSHIAFSPDGKRFFVTMQGDRAVVAFDIEAGAQLWSVEVGPEPAGITWHDGKLLVGIMGADHFVSIDPETQEVRPAFTIGRGAHTVFAAPDGSALYATSRVDSRLAEIDPATLAVRRVWDIPGGPDCLTFDPTGRVWMTLRWAGRVAVLDQAKGEWQTFRVGRSPHGIFYRVGPDEAAQAVAANVPPAPPPSPRRRPASTPTQTGR